ncbi:MAG: zinc-binding dehydrogenase [Gemmatimonadetes bacterium]|nr:zinc-binding dehydrogenase [Gemmatimonadota bacterium]
MRQVWIPKIGGPDVLQLREAPDPEPRESEVRIRVAAAGVNFADILARMGLYPDVPKLPAVVGYEVAGTIDKVGAGVGALREGTRVVAVTRFGGYSDTVIVRAGQALPIPHGLSFEKAAAIPVNYLTAWIMLVHLGNVRRGERVLVHAAAGGVGLGAVQICRWRGAEVIGTASATKHERLRRMGVAHCIDYTSEDFERAVKRITDGAGVDIALDAVGGKSFRKSYRCLAPLGRLFVFGFSSAAPGRRRSLWAVLKGFVQMPRFSPIALMQNNRGVIGVNVGHLWGRAEVLRSVLEEILGLVAGGTFDPVVDRAFQLDRAAEAHAYIQARRNFGKVLLVP